MKPLAKIYREFYGLGLSLLQDGNIRVVAVRKIEASRLGDFLKWLSDNKAYAINSLKVEGWE